MATIGHFAVYILTTARMLVADARGNSHQSEPACFRPNVPLLAVQLILGFLWWLLVLRKRIASGAAGPRAAVRLLQAEPSTLL